MDTKIKSLLRFETITDLELVKPTEFTTNRYSLFKIHKIIFLFLNNYLIEIIIIS